jgi:ribosomal RNA-processing protein 12
VEILVKKCGLDAVTAVMPEEHMKLLTNIRKVSSDVSQIFRVSNFTVRSNYFTVLFSYFNHLF